MLFTFELIESVHPTIQTLTLSFVTTGRFFSKRLSEMSIAFVTSRSLTEPSAASPAVLSEAMATHAFTILDLHVSARKLPKKNATSPIDSFCVFFTANASGGWDEFERTEVLKDNPNPAWAKSFAVAFFFELLQRVRIAVYSAGSANGALKAGDVVGEVETSVQALVCFRGAGLALDLKSPNGGSGGSLLLTLEQQMTSGAVLSGRVSAQDLRKVYTFSRNWPFVQVEKPSENGGRLSVYRSEIIPKAMGGTWKKFSIGLPALCNGDMKCPITLHFFDQHEGRAPQEIGLATEALEEIVARGPTFTPLQWSGKPGKKAGDARFLDLQIIRQPTLYDYLRAGLQFNLVTAINFTTSNGSPKWPSSFHHLSPGRLNPYESSLYAVGSVICPYDGDQLFAVYGFGATVDGQVSHCFPLTFNPADPNVRGLEEIIGVYRTSIEKIEFSSPAFFAPVIIAATELANESWRATRTYTVLMIVTDGALCDQGDAIDAIVRATDTALSIIIIGVGRADFKGMSVLEGEDGILRSRSGQRAKRDIVQFAPAAKFDHQFPALAAEMLAEIPKQVHTFCSAQKFIPPRQA
jgi:hypothetical protein